MTEVLVPLSDGDLFCRVIGHGPPVVLLHGYSQDQRVFAGWEDGLTRHRTVILVDSRNHGRSWKTRQVSIPLMAGDVAGVLAWLGYDRAAVVGYSDGGNVALQLAADHGEMVEKLVVISGNATPGGLRAGPRFVYNAGYWLTRLVSGTPGMLRLITREPQLSSDDLRRITVPALLVYAERDVVARTHIAYLGDTIPQAQVLTVPGVTHFSILAKPERYLDDVLAFLDA